MVSTATLQGQKQTELIALRAGEKGAILSPGENKLEGLQVMRGEFFSELSVTSGKNSLVSQQHQEKSFTLPQ